jgi:hypothetical protein
MFREQRTNIQRLQTYDKFYRSDIFNQHPPKSIQKQNYNYFDNNYNDYLNYYQAEQQQNQYYNNNNKNLKKKNNLYHSMPKTSSAPNFLKVKVINNNKQNKNRNKNDNDNKNNFHTTYNDSFKNIPEQTKRNLFYHPNIPPEYYVDKFPIYSSQETPYRYDPKKNSTNQNKSNIFNIKEKDFQNRETEINYKKKIHNNWSTNLDWRNSKTELVFYNDNQFPLYDKNSNNEEEINKIKKQKIKNYYDNNNKNILNHKYIVYNNNKDYENPYLDMVKIKKDFENKGMHFYNENVYSDFLKGHQNQYATFNIRENDINDFNNKFNQFNFENNNNNNNFNECFCEQCQNKLIVKNIGNEKINVHPKKHYRQCNSCGRYFAKKGKIKEYNDI